MASSPANYADLGYLRAAAVAPEIHLADPLANAAEIVGHLERLESSGAALAVFPELCLTGYSSEDLLLSAKLLADARAALGKIVGAGGCVVAVVGTPWPSPDGRLFNAAAVIAGGRIAGIVPKTALPTTASSTSAGGSLPALAWTWRRTRNSDGSGSARTSYSRSGAAVSPSSSAKTCGRPCRPAPPTAWPARNLSSTSPPATNW